MSQHDERLSALEVAETVGDDDLDDLKVTVWLHLDEALRARALERVVEFRPVDATSVQWRAIRGPMLSLLFAMRPASFGEVVRLLTRLAQFFLWALESGRDVTEPRRLLVEHYVDAWIATLDHLTSTSAASYRSVLARHGRVLNAAGWSTPVVRGRTDYSGPYRGDELAAVETAQFGLPPRWASRAAGAVALGLGCGLATSDHMAGLTAADIRRDNRGRVLVDVSGRRERRVYARHDWADRIWAVKKDRGTAPFICEDGAPGNNAFNRITEAVKDHGGPEVTSARLRATWLVWHLERGTRLDVLCEAAGLSTAMSLGALLPHVTPLDPAEAADLVRGLP